MTAPHACGRDAAATDGAPARLLRLAAVAVATRYGPGRRHGLLRLAAAVLDPFIYAAIAYFVVAGAFGRSGFDRYVFLAVGFVSFRWTLSCLLESADFAEVRARMAEVARRADAAALTVAVAPPTVVALISFAGIAILLAVVRPAGQQFAALGWLAPVLVAHALWNLVLVLAVDRLRRRRWLTSERPVMVAAALLWLMSPNLYKFSDLPAAASLLFTSLNPVSHMLAAYDNALWFGRPISLEVLPAAALVAAVLLAAAARDRKRPAGAPPRAPGLPLLVVSDPAHPSPAAVAEQCGSARRFRPWSGRTRGLTGRDMVRLIAAGSGRDVTARIVEASALGRLIDEDLALYPPGARARLAFAAAVESGAPAFALDGVLDDAEPDFAARAWARLEAEAAAGRTPIVVSRRLLALPSGAQGRFVAVSGGPVVAEGAVGSALAAFYRRLVDTGQWPAPAR